MSDLNASTSSSRVVRHNPPSMLDATEIGNSQISVSDGGRLAFIAGQTATRRDGGAVSPDLPSQAQFVAGQLAAALTELGATPKDVVAFRMYVVNATTASKKHGNPSTLCCTERCRAALRSVCRRFGRLNCSSRSRWSCEFPKLHSAARH